ncbi:Short C-terminal domain containing protein [Desulfocurvibacter africanus PCS]|uniref:Short C-terminal domain containing protein n=1 Tax=Desulfocurvibacter africanus PCS TaxID=1262666 RepID=M5Q2M9_DESAF|nr:SHOCT domain-containing protein [Desulfocurvibacter africanus]EMG38606.1 Short C-terminal domain containing protein [Desulfocurvibacter africanus PCS]
MWCNFSGPLFSGPGFFWGGGLIGLLLKILIVAGIVWLALRIIDGIRNRQTSGDDKDHSMRILKVKYARGEISEDEYRRMREVLDGRGQPT